MSTYLAQDLRARLQELTAGKGVERAIDCVAGELGAEIARNLAPAGTMLVATRAYLRP